MIHDITLRGETRTAVVLPAHYLEEEVREFARAIIDALDAVSSTPDSKDSMSAHTMSLLLTLFKSIDETYSRKGGPR